MPDGSSAVRLTAKAASGALDWPMYDQRDYGWEQEASEPRIRKWASSDGSGDKDKIDWAKYASVHFWRDPNMPEQFGGYKLKFCDVVGGRVVAIWRGVALCAAVMQGARGGVDMPDADRPGVRNKIEAYYAKARDTFNDGSIHVPWASGKNAVARRAWSTLEIKAVDTAKRVITGIASTPSTDRMGDVVDPLGAKFALPLPFLWQHNGDQPIGNVVFAKPTKDGIPFRAEVAPAGVAQFIDEAWNMINAGLVRGASIGFDPLEYSRFADTGGLHFTAWEWLELSAVTIPANVEATIQVVKSYDRNERAASGRNAHLRVVRLDSPPGVSGPYAKAVHRGGGKSRQEPEMKTIGERIGSWEAKRAATAAARQQIMELAEEESRTLNEDEAEKHTALAKEVKDIDDHLARLREEMAASQAAAAALPREAANDPDAATKARSGGAASPVFMGHHNNLPKGTAFTRYAIALARSKGNLMQAQEISKQWHDSTPEVELTLKTAVAAGTTSDATWAAPLVYPANMAAEFVELLRPQTILGRIQGLRRIPFNVRMPRATAGSSGHWVGQGAPKPVNRMSFDTITMPFTKIATIIVMTSELVRFSNPSAEEVVRQDMIGAIAQFSDQQFIDPTIAASGAISPASITHGTPTFAHSAGASIANVTTDVETLFGSFVNNNIPMRNPVFVMHPRTALALSLLRTSQDILVYPTINLNGGTLVGIPVVTSANVPIDSGGLTYITLMDAAEVFLADDGDVTLDVSMEASLQMSDTPSAGAQSLVSLWQNDMVGVRAERYINWQRRRDAAVAVVYDVSY